MIFTWQLLIRILASFVCSVAFAVMFRVSERHLPFAGLSGVIVYFVYHVIVGLSGGVFLAALLSTAVGAVYAEIYARVRRCPVIVMLSAAIIPTVPGGDLYKAMRSILLADMDAALAHLSDTLGIALGIGGGIVIIALAFRVITDKILSKGKKKQ